MCVYLLANMTTTSCDKRCFWVETISVIYFRAFNVHPSKSISLIDSEESFRLIILVLPPVSCQILPPPPPLCLAQPIAMSLAVVRYWGEQRVFIMGQTSRCCMVCVMPQSQVSLVMLLVDGGSAQDLRSDISDCQGRDVDAPTVVPSPWCRSFSATLWCYSSFSAFFWCHGA